MADPNITAKIQLQTQGEGVLITSFVLTFPRFILAEVNTHRVLAKSSASSRAIPIANRIAEVKYSPFCPKEFGENKRGMQSVTLLGEEDAAKSKEVWLKSSAHAVVAAQDLADLKNHKQHANRLLEPYLYHKALVTGTEWRNFFNLRDHADAQPEFRELAGKMREAYSIHTSSEPSVLQDAEGKTLRMHLPFCDPSADEFSAFAGLKGSSGLFMGISSARCARLSYQSLKTGLRSLPAEDQELAFNLIDDGHMSPFDHPAYADTIKSGRWCEPDDHRHFYGWIPVRAILEKESGFRSRRNSHAVVTESDMQSELRGA